MAALNFSTVPASEPSPSCSVLLNWKLNGHLLSKPSLSPGSSPVLSFLPRVPTSPSVPPPAGAFLSACKRCPTSSIRESPSDLFPAPHGCSSHQPHPPRSRQPGPKPLPRRGVMSPPSSTFTYSLQTLESLLPSTPSLPHLSSLGPYPGVGRYLAIWSPPSMPLSHWLLKDVPKTQN